MCNSLVSICWWKGPVFLQAPCLVRLLVGPARARKACGLRKDILGKSSMFRDM